LPRAVAGDLGLDQLALADLQGRLGLVELAGGDQPVVPERPQALELPLRLAGLGLAAADNGLGVPQFQAQALVVDPRDRIALGKPGADLGDEDQAPGHLPGQAGVVAADHRAGHPGDAGAFAQLGQGDLDHRHRRGRRLAGGLRDRFRAGPGQRGGQGGEDRAQQGDDERLAVVHGGSPGRGRWALSARAGPGR